MAGTQVVVLRLACAGPITHAVVGRAQKGSPLDDMLACGGVAHGRLRRVIAAACVGPVVGRPAVACDLPYVADHVEQAIGIGRVAARWREPDETVIGGIGYREQALPGVGVGGLLMLPGPGLAGAGRPFPLRLGGQVKVVLGVKIG